MAERTLRELREARDRKLNNWATIEAHRQVNGSVGESGDKLMARFKREIKALDAEIESRSARSVGLRLRERRVRADD